MVCAVTNKPLKLLVLASLIFVLVYEARPTSVHDYIFSITGVVTAEDGTPVQGAEITLEVNGPVYKGVEPIKTVKLMTDNTGGFVFMYISHKRGVKYTITVYKQGFAPVTVSGNSPPTANHVVRLQRTGGEGSTSRPK
jgi:phosphohistidine swiveling domain-containing protein